MATWKCTNIQGSILSSEISEKMTNCVSSYNNFLCITFCLDYFIHDYSVFCISCTDPKSCCHVFIICCIPQLGSRFVWLILLDIHLGLYRFQPITVLVSSIPHGQYGSCCWFMINQWLYSCLIIFFFSIWKKKKKLDVSNGIVMVSCMYYAWKNVEHLTLCFRSTSVDYKPFEIIIWQCQRVTYPQYTSYCS